MTLSSDEEDAETIELPRKSESDPREDTIDVVSLTDGSPADDIDVVSISSSSSVVPLSQVESAMFQFRRRVQLERDKLDRRPETIAALEDAVRVSQHKLQLFQDTLQAVDAGRWNSAIDTLDAIEQLYPVEYRKRSLRSMRDKLETLI